MKAHARAFTFALALSPLVGCSHSPIQPESLSGQGIAVVETDSNSIRIPEVDGRSKRGFLNQSMWEGYPRKIELRPGKHVLAALYMKGLALTAMPAAIHAFKLDAKAGRTYMIKHRTNLNSPQNETSIWIEDTSTSEEAGETLAATNEPVDLRTAVLSQSDLFKWKTPQDEGWRIIQRSNQELLLGKEGKTNDETFAITVTVATLPNIEGREEFEKFVRTLHEWGTPDSERYEPLVGSLFDDSGREELCVRYHGAVVDKKPEDRTPFSDPVFRLLQFVVNKARKQDPLKIESHGYFCQHPRNKNLVIDFSYTHRSHDHAILGGMATDAKRYFSTFEF